MRVAIGIILFLSGIILRLMAMLKLGRNFTTTLESPDRIETGGIYRLMRHPSYLGSIMMILGLYVFLDYLGIVLMSWTFFSERIRNEEKILKQRNDYRNYSEKTGIFWPKIKRS